ncbi:MAG: FAD-binding oxidoreductase [Nisaea sp.]|nr:FAD-binding oxidoreductase [Nisaea sp.]
MSNNFDAIIIGAGITGASTAYHLKKNGVNRILLLDRRGAAAGGTGKSAAICRQHYSTSLMARLALESISMMAEIEKEKAGSFFQSGYMMLLPPTLIEAAAKNLELQQSVGVETRFLSKQEITTMAPWLNTDGVAEVIFEQLGGYADPVRITEYFVHKFVENGGEFRNDTPCRGLIKETDRVAGVVLDSGPLHADIVVNAAGPWAPIIAKMAGIELEVRAVREQDSIWQARSNRPLPSVSISNAVDSIYVRPMGENRFLIGQGFPKDYFDVDPYNFKQTADDEFVNLILQRTSKRYPTLEGMQLISAYSALYDVTPDWYPFIGPRSDIKGYYDASGGSGHGFKIGPAVGKELANWIVKGETSDDFSQLSYDRLASQQLFIGAYGGNRG